MWIVTQAKQQLGLDIDKFVCAGDSAGGHLTVSVSFVAMLRGFRIPDGLFCHYPVFQMSQGCFTPSLLLSLDEELLNQGFLTFASACFLRKGGNPDKSCLVSPLNAPDAMLKRLPPCRFMVAEVDCLRDHSFLMGLRILKLGEYCYIILMNDFIHGFNNMDTNYVGVNEYRRGTNETLNHFITLFEQIKGLKDERNQASE